jgi:hypothetical protein
VYVTQPFSRDFTLSLQPVTAGLSLWFGLRMYWITPNSRLLNIFYRDGAFYFVTIAGVYILSRKNNY